MGTGKSLSNMSIKVANSYSIGWERLEGISIDQIDILNQFIRENFPLDRGRLSELNYLLNSFNLLNDRSYEIEILSQNEKEGLKLLRYLSKKCCKEL